MSTIEDNATTNQLPPVGINLTLLKQQRGTVYEIITSEDDCHLTEEQTLHLDGLINMIDSVCDELEGFGS